MAHSRHVMVRGRSQRRQTLWLGGTEVSTVIPAANGVVLQTSLNAAALALRPFTIIRSRGRVCVFSDQRVASEFYSAAYGNIVVTDQASAAGVASVPTPVTEDNSDWHVYKRMQQRVSVTTDVGVLLFGLSEEFDSKAMRKVDLGEDLISVWESSGLSNGIQVIAYTRVLVKLH